MWSLKECFFSLWQKHQVDGNLSSMRQVQKFDIAFGIKRKRRGKSHEFSYHIHSQKVNIKNYLEISKNENLYEVPLVIHGEFLN